jgi:hypothetical protein
LRDALVREDALTTELAGLREQNREARAERDALLSSPEAIERVAREDYGLSAPGETVEPFDPPPERTGPAPVALAGISPWQRVLIWPHLQVALPVAVFLLTAVIVAVLNATRARRDGSDLPPGPIPVDFRSGGERRA